MKSLQLLFILVLLSRFVQAQNPAVEMVTKLDDMLAENSGLLNLDGKIVTHNDSEGDSKLYEIDTQTGAVSRTITITNAENQDWEDMAQDQHYIYIGDIGNNTGERTSLRIYRILKTDYLSSNDTARAEVIEYTYADQTDFTPSAATNYDAEAFVALNDKIYIFTKNWGNRQSTLYSLPKTPGSYQAKRIGAFATQGMVTGATYHEAEQKITLIGYTPVHAFLFQISGFSDSNILDGVKQRYDLEMGQHAQIEGVCARTQGGLYVSSEGNTAAYATLFHLNLNTVTSSVEALPAAPAVLYPNPASQWLHVTYTYKVKTEIFDLAGNKLISTNVNPVHIAPLRRGVYLVRISKANGELLKTERLIVN